MPMSEPSLKNNSCIAWHTERFGSLVLLPEGAYLGTRKHY